LPGGLLLLLLAGQPLLLLAVLTAAVSWAVQPARCLGGRSIIISSTRCWCSCSVFPSCCRLWWLTLGAATAHLPWCLLLLLLLLLLFMLFTASSSCFGSSGGSSSSHQDPLAETWLLLPLAGWLLLRLLLLALPCAGSWC
jgi:hypothetical protein